MHDMCHKEHRALMGHQNFVKTRQFLIKRWQPTLCSFHDLLKKVKYNLFLLRLNHEGYPWDLFLPDILAHESGFELNFRLSSRDELFNFVFLFFYNVQILFALIQTNVKSNSWKLRPRQTRKHCCGNIVAHNVSWVGEQTSRKYT